MTSTSPGSGCPGPHQRLVYNLEDAAEQSSISLRGLSQLTASGEIRAITYGEGRRRVGVIQQALLDWIESREAAGQPGVRWHCEAAVALAPSTHEAPRQLAEKDARRDERLSLPVPSGSGL
jgi:hypothetical protein